jgi:hypothetical protein
MAKARHTAVKARHAIGKLFRTIGQKFAIAIGFCRRRLPEVAAASRRLITATIRPAPLKQVHKPSRTAPVRPAVKPHVQPGNASKFEILLISICFGLLTISAIIIATLFIQIKELKMEVAQTQRATMARLERLEKTARQRIVIKEPPVSEPQPQLAQLALNEADRKLIRQFIKVLPPKPGAQPKIHLGDKISDVTLVPVPESLVEQVPKLRGARFSIDQNGSIIIIGEGSSRADAVIAPN